MVKFSVVVPVYNTASYLKECIASLRRLDYPAGEYEILMVDNNSTDGSAAILAEAEGIRVLHETKQGSYAARNRALKEARGSFLAFTDSDCMPDPGWLRAIERTFLDPTVQVVLGYRRPAESHGLVKLLSDYESKKDELVFSSSSPDIYYGFTNNMGVRRSACDTYGPFMERHRGADTIFVRRVVDGEGCEAVAYASTMSVRHAEMDGMAAYCKKMFIYGRSQQLYSRIVPSRPLSVRERLKVLKRCLRDEHYSLGEALSLTGALAVGLSCWSLGSHSRHLRIRPPESER